MTASVTDRVFKDENNDDNTFQQIQHEQLRELSLYRQLINNRQLICPLLVKFDCLNVIDIITLDLSQCNNLEYVSMDGCLIQHPIILPTNPVKKLELIYINIKIGFAVIDCKNVSKLQVLNIELEDDDNASEEGEDDDSKITLINFNDLTHIDCNGHTSSFVFKSKEKMNNLISLHASDNIRIDIHAFEDRISNGFPVLKVLDVKTLGLEIYGKFILLELS